MEKLTSRGNWPKTTEIARRGNSDSRLYCDVVFPALDKQDVAYHVQIQASTADPETELGMIEFVARAVNATPVALDAMAYALEKLDSVAFLSRPGDTATAKASLRNAIEKLRSEVSQIEKH